MTGKAPEIRPEETRLNTALLKRSQGFTLIEVVLALTIFALMGTILYGAFSLGHSAVEKSQVSSNRNQKFRALADLLGSYVRSAYPYRETPEEQSVYFEGENESLVFVSAYSRSLGGRGMARISITKEDGGSVLKLEESTPVRLGSSPGGGQSQSIVLEREIKELRIAYLDPRTEEEKWEENWNGREQRALPRAVRLTYRNEHGKEVRWIFPIMMTALGQ